MDQMFSLGLDSIGLLLRTRAGFAERDVTVWLFSFRLGFS
jgi:hypothetical protein